MNHTKEPWDQNTHGIQPASNFKQVPAEDYRRATMCVNACQGIEDPEKFIQDAKDRNMEEERFNKAADQAIKDTENAREYLIKEGLDPDEIGKMGSTFVRVLMEKTKAGAKLAQMSCMMGVGDGSGQLFVHGNYESIKAAQLIVDQRNQAWKDDKEIREMIGADDNESTVDEVQSLLLNYRRAKDQMYKVRNLIDSCADEFTELVNLVRPGESEKELKSEMGVQTQFTEAPKLMEKTLTVEVIQSILAEGIKIIVVGDGKTVQVYSNIRGNYFDVSVDINPNVTIENRTVRHKEDLHRID